MNLGKHATSNLCFAGNRKLLSLGTDGKVLVWDLERPSAKPGVITHDNGRVMAIAASRDGQKLITLGGGTVRLWLHDGTENQWKSTVLKKVEDTVGWIDLLGDGRWLLSGNSNGSAYTSLVDLESKNPSESYFQLPSFRGPVGRSASDPKGRVLLVTAAGYEPMYLREPERIARAWLLSHDDPSALPIALPNSDIIFDVSVSSGGLMLATGAGDGSVRLWTIEDDGLTVSQLPLRGHEKTIYRVMFSPDDHWLVTTSADETARLWDLTNGNMAGAIPKVLEASKSTAVISDDGGSLFFAGKEALIVDLWNSRNFHAPCDPPATGGRFSPDGRYVIATSRLSNQLSVLPVGQELTRANCRRVIASGQNISWWGVSGKWIAVASQKKFTNESATIEVFDLGEKAKRIVKETIPKVVDAAWSPDGTLFVAAQLDGSVAVWRATDSGFERTNRVLRAGDPFANVSFSQDGRWLAAGAWGGAKRNKTIRLWRIRSNEFALKPLVLDESVGEISSLTWSPNGDWLAVQAMGAPLELGASTRIRQKADLPFRCDPKAWRVPSNSVMTGAGYSLQHTVRRRESGICVCESHRVIAATGRSCFPRRAGVLLA